MTDNNIEFYKNYKTFKPSLKQCIKMTVTTVKEYFFIVTADPQDKSTWIYAHQTLTSLCLHKLDRKTMTKVL